MILLPYNISTTEIFINTKLTYQQAKIIYINSKIKATDKNNVFKIINDYLIKQEQDKLTCSICLDTIKENELTTLKCSHTYHTSCLRDYIITYINNKCSICRGHINPKHINLKNINRTVKKKYSKKVKHKIDICKNRRNEIIKRYEYYKEYDLNFGFLTDLYEVSIQMLPYADDYDDGSYSDSDSDSNSDIDMNNFIFIPHYGLVAIN